MATLVSFHAHPDDEVIQCGGTIARAARDGHHVVLVYATKGEHGEVADGVLADDEALWERRVQETQSAATILGAHDVRFLGYLDSGMMDTPENEHPDSFWQADVDAAAARLADILREVGADVLTVYDDHGGYGHPDHIQVHRVGVRAAELAGTPQVLEATMNRDRIREMVARQSELAAEAMAEGDGVEVPDLGDDFGSPAEIITTTVDVSEFAGLKRKAMAAHASQIPEDSFFLQLPDEMFTTIFGHEFFIRRGVPSDHRDDDVFAGLA